jgi:hypothetical protein
MSEVPLYTDLTPRAVSYERGAPVPRPHHALFLMSEVPLYAGFVLAPSLVWFSIAGSTSPPE